MANALGLDFGTTNTVLAQASQGSDTASISFRSTAGESDTMRTALSFIKDPQLGAAALQVEAISKSVDRVVSHSVEMNKIVADMWMQSAAPVKERFDAAMQAFTKAYAA